MQIKKSLFTMLLSIFLSYGNNASAALIVEMSASNVASKIFGLEVLGVVYDIEFANLLDNTFNGDSLGATAARDAINAALNTTDAQFVKIVGAGVVNNFGVQNSNASTVRGVNFGAFGGSDIWQNSSSTALNGPIAQFSVHVPEPGTVILFGLGLAGLGLRRRKAA